MHHQSETPFISVVIPTCKRRWRLEVAVRSILEQTFNDWELIVTDDEKPGGETWQWLQELAAGDSRIHPTQHLDDHGQAANTNHGMAQARGVWIKLLHDDDRLLPNCLAQLAYVAKAVDEQVVLITTGKCDSEIQQQDQSDTPILADVKRYRGNEAVFGMYLQHDVGGTVPSSMLLRARMFHDGVKFENERVLPTAVDSWFKVRLLTHGDLVHIDRPLIVKCEDDVRSVTNSVDERDLDREFELIRQMMQPLVDPTLRPPPLKVVQGQVRLIRAMYQLIRRHPLQALMMTLSVWHPRAWWLALKWALRHLHPSWCNHVKTMDGSPIR
jgi:glycosyltransferase involved in cell wall biosynthesis